MQQHESEQPVNFSRRWWRHQPSNQTPKADRLSAQIGPYQRFASSRHITFVEDEIDHSQHRVETRGQLVRVGHLVRNSCVANLALRPHEPLRHCRRGHQKCSRNFVGLQTAQRAECQRDLRFRRERGVTTGEDQAQTIVGDFDVIAGVVIRFLDSGNQSGLGVRFKLFFDPCATPEAVDSLVLRRLNNPCPGKLRHTVGPPLIYGGDKGFLRSVLGHLEVAEVPNKGGHDPAPVGVVHCVYRSIGVWKHDLSVPPAVAGGLNVR